MQSEIKNGYEGKHKKNVRQQTSEGVGISWFRQTRKFKRGQIQPFEAIDDQNLSGKWKGSSILTFDHKIQFLGPKSPKKVKWDSLTNF